ncbi:MAG TPA: tetratricopeptide repeat protein, partial [Thermoanaerobaculia bacterium]|nr:tetratricopeptide repeat protein [Thermoanaerobaculia bacterium]
KTLTMADLYANQGLIDEARDIYEDVLARDPDNAVVLAKLQALEEMGRAPQQPWSEEEPADEEPAPSAFTADRARDEESPFGMKPPEDEEPTLELRHPQMGKDAGEVSHSPLSEAPAADGKVKKLESWLSKVKRPGVGSV